MKTSLKWAVVLAVLGGVLTTLAFLGAFYYARVQTFSTTVPVAREIALPAVKAGFPAPPESQASAPAGTVAVRRPWFSQKIFFFHVPIAVASLLVFTIAAIFSVLFLVKRKKSYDTRSRIAMEATLIFIVGTMISGDLWTRASWGVWWEWEPRLTTYAIMTLLVIAYFVLRNSVEDEERRATYAAVFSIFAWIDAPITFMITRIMPSQHPALAAMETSNLIPFMVGMAGMCMLGFAIYELRFNEEHLRERLAALKDDLEG
ncbi:MAG: cytochrome c biogenesis protein [Coriobacteriia bacterium]|nr:cytochrome c biogenesis protein [Coriobacteriia bacterium]